MLEDQNFILKEILEIVGQQHPQAVVIAGDVFDKGHSGIRRFSGRPVEIPVRGFCRQRQPRPSRTPFFRVASDDTEHPHSAGIQWCHTTGCA